MIVQRRITAFHPNRSEQYADPQAERALPIYVQAFNIPDMVDTPPYFAKWGGIIQISSRLTPCIHPVRTADRAADIAA